MPANLTPQYHKAEDAYRKAQSVSERIACLEEMLRVIPKHKGTDHLQADLKTRLKESRAELEQEKKCPPKGKKHKIPAQGAGQIVVLGAPNSGKSRILASLTKASVEVAAYPYTTHEPVPGMMSWEDVSVQLIDTPPISETHFEPYLTGMIRAADACLLCFDGSSDDAAEETLALLKQLQQRKTLLARQTGFFEDDFSIVQINAMIVITRANDSDVQTRWQFFQELAEDEQITVDLPPLHVDLDSAEDCKMLRNQLYQLLGVIRIYTKKPGKKAEYKDPFTIPVGGTIETLAWKIHGDIAESLKFAKVWGKSAHDGQSVGKDHVLCDRDLVELHT